MSAAVRERVLLSLQGVFCYNKAMKKEKDSQKTAVHGHAPELSAQPEGELAVDIVDKDDKLLVIATIAGADPKDIDVHVHDDVLTIRGKREAHKHIEEDAYVHRECFWGAFSRTIILPLNVKADGVKAEYRNGVLTVELPKDKRETHIPISVVD